MTNAENIRPTRPIHRLAVGVLNNAAQIDLARGKSSKVGGVYG